MISARKIFSRTTPVICIACFLFCGLSAIAQTGATNAPAPAAASGSMPDMGASLIRVFGALVFVIGIFLGGVWLFRNWQRIAVRKGISPKLQILEVKSLGQRQALYVVGYQQQRMLIGASPAGITLLSHLPVADESETTPTAPTKISFTDALQQVLNRKPK
jgi:flagellar biogenesis protein FliO